MLTFQRNKTVPGITSALEDSKGILWWGRRELVLTLPGILVGSARWSDATTSQTALPQGLLLGKVRSSGKLKEWNAASTDGSEDIYGVLMHEQDMTDSQAVDQDRLVSVIIGGPIKPSGFYINGTLAAGINAHSQELLIRTQLQNRMVFDDEPQMGQFGGWRQVKDKTAAFTVVEADNNTLFTNANATADMVVTLPAAREGFRVGFYVAASEKIVLSTASDTIIADGNLDNDELDIPPEIGTYVELLCKDASNYLAIITPGSPSSSHASDRYKLDWTAGELGLPAAAADRVSDTGATSTIADPHMILVGTNHSTGDATIDPEGGVIIQTDGAKNDQEIVCPHTTASVTAWTGVTWGLDQELEWECRIKTGSTGQITETEMFAGLKLTNNPSIATDANQAYFFFSDAHATITANWVCVLGAGGAGVGVGTETDSGVALAIDTEYHLKITVDSDLFIRFYIDGDLVHTSAAAITTADLIPYIGIEDISAGGATKLMKVRGQSISRNMA